MLRVRVEYAVFSRYDLQPPLTFTYALDGSTVRIGMNALICSASCVVVTITSSTIRYARQRARSRTSSRRIATCLPRN